LESECLLQISDMQVLLDASPIIHYSDIQKTMSKCLQIPLTNITSISYTRGPYVDLPNYADRPNYLVKITSYDNFKTIDYNQTPV